MSNPRYQADASTALNTAHNVTSNTSETGKTVGGPRAARRTTTPLITEEQQ